MSYRVLSIFGAAFGASLSSVGVWWQVKALAKFRTDDFLDASVTEDFYALGTCVETITEDQLKDNSYHKLLETGDSACSDDGESGRQKAMQRSLEVSVHGLYYMYFVKAASTDPQIEQVVESVLTATIGPSTIKPTSVNVSSAYKALSLVAEQATPVDCDIIYEMNGEASITSAVARTYLANLRKGRVDEDDSSVNFLSWPSSTVPVTCDDVEPVAGVGAPIDVTSPLSTPVKESLYGHCLAQFHYAAAGTLLEPGTYGIPIVGEKAGPGWVPYPNAAGYNSTSDYNTKTRMFLGQRFGLSVFAYVPMIMTSCYLCADSVVFFLAEATAPNIMLETQTTSDGSRLSMVRDSLVVKATKNASRAARFGIAFLAILISTIFYFVYVILPWSSFGSLGVTRLGRPICETGDPDHDSWAGTVGWKGTRGGWKADWDATYYEIVVIGFQLLTLFVEAIVSIPIFNSCNSIGRVGGRRRAVSSTPDPPELVGTKKEFQRLYRYFFGVLALGAILIIAGQAVSGARFGMAWAEGVVGQETYTDPTTGTTTLAFNEVVLAEKIYDQTIATVVLVMALGFLIGVALQRHLIAAAGCFSAMIFFGWVALLALGGLPILVYSTGRAIFNRAKANEDCEVFPSEGYGFEREACNWRFWTLLGGGLIVLVVLGFMTIQGFLEAGPNLARVRTKAAARVGKLVPNSSIFRASGKANTIQESVDPHYELGGFRSEDESFFNFKTPIIAAGPTSGHASAAGGGGAALLQPPRVRFAFPSNPRASRMARM